MRAILKTTNHGPGDLAQIQDVRSQVDTLWTLFDPLGTGHITEDEFKKQDGLADTIIGELLQTWATKFNFF